MVVSLEVAPGRGLRVPALVDSGADSTIFPGEYLATLGTEFDRLPSGPESIGAGGAFEVRRCGGVVKFREWLVCEEFNVAEPGKLSLALLGRDDFFARFVVRFNWHEEPPVLFVDPVAT